MILLCTGGNGGAFYRCCIEFVWYGRVALGARWYSSKYSIYVKNIFSSHWTQFDKLAINSKTNVSVSCCSLSRWLWAFGIRRWIAAQRACAGALEPFDGKLRDIQNLKRPNLVSRKVCRTPLILTISTSLWGVNTGRIQQNCYSLDLVVGELTVWEVLIVIVIRNIPALFTWCTRWAHFISCNRCAKNIRAT